MSETLCPVSLSVDEILRLDGLVNPNAQAVVDKVKLTMSFGEYSPRARLLAAVVTDAKTLGVLRWQSKFVHDCKLCGFSGEYQKYKTGRNRGSTNFDKPRTCVYGVELAERVGTVKGSITIGGCKDCVEALVPDIQSAIECVPCQLPPQLRRDGWPVYRVSPTMLCACGWSGHEEEMKKERTMMGDGWYPAGCPKCARSNSFVRRELQADFKALLLMNMAARICFPVGKADPSVEQNKGANSA